MWLMAGDPVKILLVEDAALLRYAFGRLLRMNGFVVRETNNGREALDCLAEFRPDEILTDLMMPVMDGVELIRRIRSDPEAGGAAPPGCRTCVHNPYTSTRRRPARLTRAPLPGAGVLAQTIGPANLKREALRSLKRSQGSGECVGPSENGATTVAGAKDRECPGEIDD